jgi:NTP pyrophosphatase (non-canonical NTP hydrolase)
MHLQELQARAIEIQQLYFMLNEQEHGRRWSTEETMLGFVGDVGDLARLVMAAEGVRDMPGGRAALAHELADCLWSILVLANAYQIDLETAFNTTMDQLRQSIGGRLASANLPPTEAPGSLADR